MYIIETTDSDTEAGYEAVRSEVDDIRYAMAAVIDADNAGVPPHRLDISKRLRDPEEKEDYEVWRKNGDEFIEENRGLYESFLEYL